MTQTAADRERERNRLRMRARRATTPGHLLEVRAVGNG